jgi:hypothetical protein
MEKALYIESTSRLNKPMDGYTRVYFGAEFCEWRMPGPAAVLKAYESAVSLGLGFTLLTPWLTDRGMSRLNRVLTKLRDAGAQNEVVINDLGAMALLRDEFPNFTPVIGRLHSRQKRCPRVPAAMSKMPGAGREIYAGTAFSDNITAEFLRSFGICRAEMDATLQGMDARLRDAGISGSIYTPYALVTLTRHCPSSFDGEGWQSFTGCKLKGCRNNVLALSNPAHEHDSLIMRGNAQFVQVPGMPEGLESMGIDRVVVMEDVS